MLPTFDPNLKIAEYERRELDDLQPGTVELDALLNQHEFVRIRGLANFWQADEQVDLPQHVIDFVIGAHGYNDYLTFVLASHARHINLYVAVRDHTTSSGLLRSAYPGIQLQEQPVHRLGATLKAICANVGLISGIPSRHEPSNSQSSQPGLKVLCLERIIQGMRGFDWVYVVRSFPRPTADVVADRQQILEDIAQIASASRAQIQRSTQTSSARTQRQTETISETMGGEIINRHAEYAVQLLEKQLERLETCLAVGRWQTAVYFGAAHEEDARRLGQLLVGLFAGPDSCPDPVRAHLCGRGALTVENKFHSYLSSEEVALLVQPPCEEAPGYMILDTATFDVDFEASHSHDLAVGAIQWADYDSGDSYRIKVHDLTRHGVVFGVTGSGKTTSLLGLLDRVWQSRTPVPFLVIEPAKTEYRALRGRVQNGRSTGPIPDLRVFTLGNDVIAPFRFNPFEFETSDDLSNALVLPHIDFLKAVFNAAFILYAPMPYVLEIALHQIYEDKGWSLATGINVRLSKDEWKNRHCYPIFPTLTDLYNKVEQVTSRLGYETRIQQDVIAGLKARLGALRLGAKGLMLDTPRGMPLSSLLAQPTVLELENIGNDDEKTFLIGLLLARLYEYRRLQATEGKLGKDLQHVLIIEEAHRLLKNVSAHVDTESSDLRAQAVETFVNMLSEVRHYGQGVLVAEQIPSKLTPDVIKNTNLKLVHRLLAQDDRDLVGSTMNMNEAQIRRLATLRRGQAVVYAEGDDHPFLIEVENYPAKHRLEMPLDSDLRSVVESYIALGQYLPTPNFGDYGVRVGRFGAPDPLVYQAALQHLGHKDSQGVWGRIIARTIFAREALPEAIVYLRQQLSSNPGHLAKSQYEEALLMLIVLSIAQALQERGTEMGWSYSNVESIRLPFTEGLIKYIRTKDLKIAAADLDRFVRLYEGSLKREVGPYPGCRACRSICFYRADVQRMLSFVELGHIQTILSGTNYKTESERYADLASTLRATVKLWLGGGGTDVRDIAYCAALVSAPFLEMNEYEQTEIASRLSVVLLR